MAGRRSAGDGHGRRRAFDHDLAEPFHGGGTWPGAGESLALVS